MKSREDRIARNETLLREVNERVKEVIPAEGGIQFICECGDEACVEQVTLSVEEYERVRSDPVEFFVKPGHQVPEVEDVVEEHDRFLLVRKHVEEQDIARRTDPRA
jgi:hypothetical protein